MLVKNSYRANQFQICNSPPPIAAVSERFCAAIRVQSNIRGLQTEQSDINVVGPNRSEQVNRRTGTSPINQNVVVEKHHGWNRRECVGSQLPGGSSDQISRSLPRFTAMHNNLARPSFAP